MNESIPEDLRYTAEHEWVRIEGDVWQIGITAYAQEQLGDVVYVDLPEPGTSVVRGQPFGEVESTKSVSDLYAPVSGTVATRNQALDAEPERVNEDPYGGGWLIGITPDDPSQSSELLEPAAYRVLTEG